MTEIKIKNKVVAVVFLILSFAFLLSVEKFALAQETETVQAPTFPTTAESSIGTPTSTSSSVGAEPASIPESAPISEASPEPVPTPEPILTPEPTSVIEPASTSEPIITPEPVQEPAISTSTENNMEIPIPDATTTPESATEVEIPQTTTEVPPMVLEVVSILDPTLDTGIIFEISTPTTKSLSGFFDLKQIQVEQKEKNGKPAPIFWQVFYQNPDGSAIQITDGEYDNLQIQPRGTKVVWKAYPAKGHADIFIYDAVSNEKKQISINNSSNDDPVLTDDGQVVWRGWDTQLGTWNIYFYNGNETVKVSYTKEGALWPSIAGDVITWQEKSNGVWQIMAYNISTHRPWLITGDSSNNEHPQTDGRNIVWQKEVTQGQHDIFIYDLKTERLWNLSKKDSGDKVLPAIRENKKITWFRKEQDIESLDFEEVDWDEKNVEELSATKPKSVEEGAVAAVNNVPVENNPVGAQEGDAAPIYIEETNIASTSPPILISLPAVSIAELSATTTEETVQEQNVIIDVSSAIAEQANPETTVSLTEPVIVPEPISEISLPPAPESTESATIPIQ